VLTAFTAGWQHKPLLDDVGDFLPGRDEFEHAAVDLPVAELSGPERVVTEVGNMQTIGEVVEHDAAFTAERAYRTGLVERLNLDAVDALTPVAGGWLEAQVLGRRARGEEHDVRLARAHSGFVRRSSIAGKESVSHRQVPSAGRSHTCPS
jgi:hypothetical protein